MSSALCFGILAVVDRGWLCRLAVVEGKRIGLSVIAPLRCNRGPEGSRSPNVCVEWGFVKRWYRDCREQVLFGIFGWRRPPNKSSRTGITHVHIKRYGHTASEDWGVRWKSMGWDSAIHFSQRSEKQCAYVFVLSLFVHQVSSPFQLIQDTSRGP